MHLIRNYRLTTPYKHIDELLPVLNIILRLNDKHMVKLERRTWTKCNARRYLWEGVERGRMNCKHLVCGYAHLEILYIKTYWYPNKIYYMIHTKTSLPQTESCGGKKSNLFMPMPCTRQLYWNKFMISRNPKNLILRERKTISLSGQKP